MDELQTKKIVFSRNLKWENIPSKWIWSIIYRTFCQPGFSVFLHLVVLSKPRSVGRGRPGRPKPPPPPIFFYEYVTLFTWNTQYFKQLFEQCQLPAPNNRDFKIHYGELLLRLLRPWGTRLTTPFPPQTSNRLRFRCTAMGVQHLRVFTKMDTFDFVFLSYDKGLINDNDFLLLCRSYVS